MRGREVSEPGCMLVICWLNYFCLLFMSRVVCLFFVFWNRWFTKHEKGGLSKYSQSIYVYMYRVDRYTGVLI